MSHFKIKALRNNLSELGERHHQTAIASRKNIAKTCLQRMTAQAKGYLILPAPLSFAAIHEPKSFG